MPLEGVLWMVAGENVVWVVLWVLWVVLLESVLCGGWVVLWVLWMTPLEGVVCGGLLECAVVVGSP